MICVSIAETNINRCIRLMNRAPMAEIRLDAAKFTNEEIQRIFGRQIPAIATCREGQFDRSERLRLLSLAIESGAKFVDIEIESDHDYVKTLVDKAKTHSCSVIISYHNYSETPDHAELNQLIDHSLRLGADIVKLAVTATCAEDNARVLGLYKPGLRLVAFCMGEQGKISRLAAPLVGAEFTFAAPNEQSATAPGQLSVKRLKNLYHLLKK